ncbi:hypothetical protein C9374_006157 [Naegleria lovaniensis]|uniref:CCAAT-binding factor domain-containing protein n=1 Tax=Naegleria lovaniensis TaxID=51637 RepID=A0AA88GNI5_NAELO|nr:uncharacterized protein C9374_006157 [Naegleria lovaniensis]KAG2381773.1 hypothetical protein C9374_006157 [Naegleria lovaniensis]
MRKRQEPTRAQAHPKTSSLHSEFKSVSQIEDIAKGIISDKKNTNNLLKLTEFLEESFPRSLRKERNFVLQSIESLLQVFSHFFDQKTLILNVGEKDTVVCDVSKEKTIQKKEYMKWVYDQYSTFTKYLPLFAIHYFTKFEESEVEIQKCVDAILTLAKLELNSANDSAFVEMDRERNRINTIVCEGPFGSLIYHLAIDTNQSEGKAFIIDYLKDKFIDRYHDLRYFTYVALTLAIRKLRSKKKKAITYPQFCENILSIIDDIPPIEDIERLFLYEGFDDSSEEEEDVMSDNEDFEDGLMMDDGTIPSGDTLMDPLGDLNSLTLPSSSEKNECKMKTRKNIMTKSIYETILRKMSEEIIPQFEDPFLLNDFISNSFDQGGLVALLSVKSLFILISEYNLVYDQFYQKLYSIIDLNLFTMDDREEFFELFDTFMKSTHLPEYIVAAFVKKFARISLFAPAYACTYILAVIYNLVSRHPQISFLVQHDEIEPKYLSRLQKKALKEQHTRSNNDHVTDPFDFHEKDPKLCNAMQSQLWEIDTLIHHSNTEVAKMAKDVKRHFAEGFPQYDIKKFTSTTTEDMFTRLAEKKRFVKLTNLDAPNGLFETKDKNSVYSIFDF